MGLHSKSKIVSDHELALQKNKLEMEMLEAKIQK